MFIKRAIVLTLLGLGSTIAHADTIYVGNGQGDYSTIQAAVDYAQLNSPVDEIIVNAGYNHPLDVETVLTGISQNLTIRSYTDENNGLDYNISLQSDGSYRILGIVDCAGIITVQGFLLTGGNAITNPDDEGGGGILVLRSEALIQDCKIMSCTAGDGGGICFGGNWQFGIGGVENCVLEQNTAQSGGGGIVCQSFQQTAGVAEVTITSTVFSNNTSLGMGGGFVQQIGDGDVLLEHCSFFDNTSVSTGGGAAFQSSGSDMGSKLTNCLLVGNAGTGVVGFHHPFNIVHPVLDDCTIAYNPATSAVFSNSPVVIRNCNMVWNASSVVPDTAVETLENSNIFGNTGGDYVGDLGAELGQNGNITVDPEFVNASLEDYRIKWTSPLVDTGNTSSPKDLDFSNSDIGWNPNYTPIELENNFSIESHGLYTMDSGENLSISTLASGLPEGAIIRMAPTASLIINLDNNGSGVSLGSPNGARTSLVGKEIATGISGSNLTFQADDFEDLQTYGVYYNDPASELSFINVAVTLDASTEDVHFNFEGLDPSPNSLIYSWDFTDCQAEVRNYDFLTEVRLKNISALRSNMVLSDCMFDVPDANSYSITLDGHMSGLTSEIRGCTFDGNSTTAVPVKLIDTQPDIQDNTINNIQNYGLYAFKSGFTMDHSARNSFLSELGTATSLNYFLFLHDSPVYIECGQNNFVFDDVLNQPSFDFIRYKGKEPFLVQGADDVKNYTDNFWGWNCTNPVSPTLRIPSWADEGNLLGWCTTYAPPFYCVDDLILSMLNDGKTAEVEEELSNANLIYENLILSYPASMEATAAAQRMRINFMELNDGSGVTELFDLAASVELDNSGLAQYLRCASSCVLAKSGDVQTASSNLTVLLDNAIEEEDAAIAQKYLLEIETFPVTGGLNSIGAQNSDFALQNARRELHLFNPLGSAEEEVEESVSSLLPNGLKLVSVYPNPFNPTTTVRFELGEEMQTAIRVYNVMGQLVETVHSGVLASGSHNFHWNATQHGSGVYFISIQTNESHEQQKILLLK